MTISSTQKKAVKRTKKVVPKYKRPKMKIVRRIVEAVPQMASWILDLSKKALRALWEFIKSYLVRRGVRAAIKFVSNMFDKVMEINDAVSLSELTPFLLLSS